MAAAGTIPLARIPAGMQEIFADVKKTGAKLIEGSECVIMPKVEYDRMTEELEDMSLAILAEKRLAAKDVEFSQAEVMAELGMTEEDLKGWEDEEIE